MRARCGGGERLGGVGPLVVGAAFVDRPVLWCRVELGLGIERLLWDIGVKMRLRLGKYKGRPSALSVK